jgi:hypothetical protein
MADVGSLGQYKVVVTADYSQLQSQFKAMSDYIADMTKSITSNLNTSMISGFTDMGKGVNKVMESSLNDTVKTTERKLNELKKKYEDFYKGLPKPEPLAMPSAPSPSSRGGGSSRSASTGFRDYASRVRAEAKAAEDFYKEQGKAILAAEERAIAGRTAAHKAFWQEQARLEGENRKRIATLGTQYKVAYEEANKYLQSHAKMSEAVFLRLQGRLTAISREMHDLGAMPDKVNPLAGLNYSDYESRFSKLNDLFASLKHHLTWMASAAAIGVTFGIPAKTVSTIAEVEKQMAQMKQVNEAVKDSQEVLNKTTQDYIGIAQKYGASVNEVIKAGVLWGRAYKDLNTVMKLTTLSTKLSVADNMDIGLANRAVESVINGYQKQGQAIQFASHVVDSWTKVAHNAQSSATDLAEALSRTGAAAKAVGVDFDTTTALASTMIKATGRSGAEVGRPKLAA